MAEKPVFAILIACLYFVCVDFVVFFGRKFFARIDVLEVPDDDKRHFSKKNFEKFFRPLPWEKIR